MFEKITETIAKFQDNPMEALKGVISERKKLQSTIIENRASTRVLVENLEKNYTKEQISEIIGSDGTLQDFIEKKMNPSIGEHLLLEVTQPLATLQSVFEESDIGFLIDQYASLFHKQPCDPKEIEEWMKSKGMTVEAVVKEKIIPIETSVEIEDEEDIKDNDNYNYDFQKNSKYSDQLEKYISLLPTFTSVGYQVDPDTKTTLCSRTAAQDAKKLFGLERKEGNAFDIMRASGKKFNKSIISKRYEEKETEKDRIDDVTDNDKMGDSDYINTIAGDNNVIDLYVTSSTVKGKKYGHRATMFRVGDQRFVIDPYTMLQPGEQKNKPRTLESYAKSMKEGGNKREFMRMDFYKSSTLESKLTTIVATLPTHKIQGDISIAA